MPLARSIFARNVIFPSSTSPFFIISNRRRLSSTGRSRYGDTAGTPGLKLVGPAGEIEITEGVIIAKRHIHMTPADAEAFGVADKQIVKVKIESERTLIFDDVVVRVNPNFALAMHIDTDECNAASAFGTVYGEVLA